MRSSRRYQRELKHFVDWLAGTGTRMPWFSEYRRTLFIENYDQTLRQGETYRFIAIERAELLHDIRKMKTNGPRANLKFDSDVGARHPPRRQRQALVLSFRQRSGTYIAGAWDAPPARRGGMVDCHAILRLQRHANKLTHCMTYWNVQIDEPYTETLSSRAGGSCASNTLMSFVFVKFLVLRESARDCTFQQ
jgi:hypothetical protein